MSWLFAGALISATFTSCKKEDEVPASASPEASIYPADVPTKWNDLELQLIRTTSGFTPPVAARALGYSNLACYEAVSPGISNRKSMDEAMNYSYTLPYAGINYKYNWSLVANAAYYQSIKSLFANTSSVNQQKMDSLYLALKASFSVNESTETIARSEAYGAEVGEVIYNWSKTDNGDAAYSNLYPSSYTPPTGAGNWVPTPPAFQPIPMLPYWGNNRPFIAANTGSACMPPAPFAFSEDSASQFYKEAKEVYETNLNLTQGQRDIALFWADGGNTYTPPGHNINIATQLLREDNAPLDKAVEVYMRMGIACTDAFIACWKAKYTHNVLRPVSYIQKYIQPGWLPLIPTPPFPEYTSGHSSVSGACSEVLTSMFGNNRSFTDHTNDGFGFSPRSFTNFYEAASEAAASRLYGGIHYRNANEKGITCGREIGKNIVRIDLSEN